MSMAAGRDGGKLNTGHLEADEENIHYRIRTSGDRNWAFSGKNMDFFMARFNEYAKV